MKQIPSKFFEFFDVYISIAHLTNEQLAQFAKLFVKNCHKHLDMNHSIDFVLNVNEEVEEFFDNELPQLYTPLMSMGDGMLKDEYYFVFSEYNEEQILKQLKSIREDAMADKDSAGLDISPFKGYTKVQIGLEGNKINVLIPVTAGENDGETYILKPL